MACECVGESKVGLLGVKLAAIGLIGTARGGDGSAVGTAERTGDNEALYVLSEEYMIPNGKKLPWIPDNFIFLVLVDIDVSI
jgi:hypothetical protein